MVFLVFLEVLEMSSEVAGPGPTHGRSNLSGLTQDLVLVCRDYQHTTTTPPITLLWWRQQHAHQLRGGCSWPCRRRASRGSTRHAPRLHGPCGAARTSTSTSYDDDNTITFHRPADHRARAVPAPTVAGGGHPRCERRRQAATVRAGACASRRLPLGARAFCLRREPWGRRA